MSDNKDTLWADEWLKYNKHYSDRENHCIGKNKSFKNVIALALSFFAIVLSLSVLGVDKHDNINTLVANASKSSELKDELDFVRKNKEATEELIKHFTVTKGEIEDYIKKLDRKNEDIQDDLINLMKQQDGIAENLEKVQQQLDEDKRNEEIFYAAMKLRMKYLYEHGSYTFMDAMAGSTSFGDMLNRTAMASKIQEYDAGMLKDYRDSLDAISEKEAYISQKKAKLEHVEHELEEERESVLALDHAKKVSLAQLISNLNGSKDYIKICEKAEADLENKMAEAENEIYDDFDEYDDDVKYVGSKLLWPTPGYYTVRSPFGYRMHPILHYRRLHAGIDISTPSGVGVYASAKGKVIIATYDSGAGNYVMIDHGGGLCTVYMHNSKLLVKKGQSVRRGQKIALTGSTGLSTGPHCHFGVRLNGQYVNPMKYFKSKNSTDDDEYSEDDVKDTFKDDSKKSSSKSSSSKSKDNSKDSSAKNNDDEGMSKYKKKAEDQGDKGDNSATLEDDGDPDSE